MANMIALEEITLIHGEGKFRFRCIENWGRDSERLEGAGMIAGIAVDSRDRLIAFSRSEDPVQVYDRDGTLSCIWGRGHFSRPHGIWISPNDIIYLTDCRDHTVKKFSIDGDLLDTMGTPGIAADEGKPFNGPNDAVEAPSGEIFVGDFVSSRIHRFSSDGKLLLSWGETGEGPGQFNHIHNVRIDSRGRVLVADRENDRIQLFDTDGGYLSEWKAAKPVGICFDSDGVIHIPESKSMRVLQYTEEGMLLGHWGKAGKGPGEFEGLLHAVAVDSHGDAYICEAHHPDRLRKFERQ